MQKNNSSNTQFTPPSSLATHEKALFTLHKFPLIDIEACLKNMNADQTAFVAIINTMLTQEFPNEIMAYHQAHNQADWEKIEKLAHKMKGGAMYTGLVKLQHACQHFEDYYHSDQTYLLESLYQQIIHVIQETYQLLETLTKHTR